jgi:hypothetical protein
MIMGAGKTTVGGPLLTLILADGKSLVTQVMPSALLEMSRNTLRSRFTSILAKRVYTLSFDRSQVSSSCLAFRLRSASQLTVRLAPPRTSASLPLSRSLHARGIAWRTSVSSLPS